MTRPDIRGSSPTSPLNPTSESASTAAEVVSRAEDANADIVLTVGEDNRIARALYARHHFLLIDMRRPTIAMRRRIRVRQS